jgi:hypothetical protein
MSKDPLTRKAEQVAQENKKANERRASAKASLEGSLWNGMGLGSRLTQERVDRIQVGAPTQGADGLFRSTVLHTESGVTVAVVYDDHGDPMMISVEDEEGTYDPHGGYDEMHRLGRVVMAVIDRKLEARR